MATEAGTKAVVRALAPDHLLTRYLEPDLAHAGEATPAGDRAPYEPAGR